jgi:CrcB protein
MSIWLRIVLVAFGGAAGALLRTGLASTVAVGLGWGPAAGTAVVNILGCLGYGTVEGALRALEAGYPQIRVLLMSGFLGAFTTFSTFQADAVGFWAEMNRSAAFIYLAISLIGGAVAFVAGMTGIEYLLK